jgi:hypothetical protein
MNAPSLTLLTGDSARRLRSLAIRAGSAKDSLRDRYHAARDLGHHDRARTLLGRHIVTTGRRDRLMAAVATLPTP